MGWYLTLTHMPPFLRSCACQPGPSTYDRQSRTPGQMHRTAHIQGFLATLQTTTWPARTSRIGVLPGWGPKPIRLPVNYQSAMTLLQAGNSRRGQESSRGEA